MLEILKYILGDFWTFIGFTTILWIVLFFGTNGAIRCFNIICKK